MAEEQTGQERTEEPTERRLSEARKKGQVPRSRELNTLLVLLTCSLALWVMGSWAMGGISRLLDAGLTPSAEAMKDPALVPQHLTQIMLSGVVLLLPILAISLIAALFGPASMGGLVFSAEAVAFKLEKLDPVKGLGRVFSPKGLVELVKALLKFCVVLFAAILVFLYFEREIMTLATFDVLVGIGRAGEMIVLALVVLSATLILIAAIDVPFQLYTHNKQLRMTKQEIKDEMKETDGRPEVKGRIRQLQRENAQRRMMQDVPTADVVITNPTHYSVALKYDENGLSAPKVVAKGKDLVAMQIRHIARANEVVIYEEPPLARALFASTEIGHEIPQQLFLAVARVLAYVFHLRRAAATDYVPRPEPVELPPEFADVMKEEPDNGD
ncbi:MAG: flagellar biosynthesis protein FlhB [Halieaceae bacterium]|jgi:flagellar biosynthetic protein FlhB|nr:flagellar biosynthesis protein FlhB [Halieaceae bacterium]